MTTTVAACHSCEGRCCTAYIVPLNGDDVWRIVQEQRLAPGLFVQHEAEKNPTSAGFLLRPRGQTNAIALRHQYDRRNERPCIFLMNLREGVQRCGIYAQRPIACQTYPMQLQPTGVIPREDMLCPGSSWAGITQRPGPWRERLIRQDHEWQRYAGVVQAWNTAVRLRPSKTDYGLDQYLAYVVAAYDYLKSFGDQLPDMARFDVALTALAEAWTSQS